MNNFKKITATLLSAVLAVSLIAVALEEPAKAEIVSTYDYYMYGNNTGATEQAIPKVYTVKNTVRQINNELATFNEPQDMFVDDNDMIYVADTGNNRIVRMDRNGQNVLSISNVMNKEHALQQKELDEQYAKDLAEYEKKRAEYDEAIAAGADEFDLDEPVKPNARDYTVECPETISTKFNTPSGVYVDFEGDIYVADTATSYTYVLKNGNTTAVSGRVVHLDPDGYFVEEFLKPKDEVLEEYPFDVTKIYISNRGVIYLLLKTNFEGFMTLDATGKYLGNTGMTWTTTDFASFIWSKLNPSAEAIQAATLKAPPYSNFIIDEDGWIYATITSTDEKQLAKLNSSGTNVFGQANDENNSKFGRNFFKLTDTVTFESEHFQSNFVDITVDSDGIVYALDNAIGNVFVYDQNGNNLAFFGESGDNRGKFQKPVSLNIFSDNTLGVLDSKTGYITIFKDTEFCRLMKKGATLYHNAEYQEAREVWSELLKIDVNYIYAHKAIAKAYYKEEKYLTAMKEYQLAKDKSGYSDAFEKYKAKITKDYFFLIVLIVVCAAILIFIGFKKLKKYAEKLHIKITTWGGGEE